MLYLARVVDNRKFGQTGTIEVFLPQKSSENGWESILQQDFKENYTKLQEMMTGLDEVSPASKLTFSCLICSPMANGANLGEFCLPQINSIGLVMEIENKNVWSKYRYIWLGGLYGARLYGEDILLPNDDTVSDSFEYVDEPLNSIEDLSLTEDNISGKDIITKGQYIVKTKTSGVVSFESLDEKMIDLAQRPSDNTFVMNKDKISLRHNDYDNDTKNRISDISFDKDSVSIKRFSGESDDKRHEQIIKISDNAITIDFNNKTDTKRVTLSFDNQGNTKLETTGNVEFHSEGDMSFKTDKTLTIYSKEAMDISTDATAKIISKQQTKIEANGVDLGKHIETMSEHYKNTNTTGAPTNHVLAPGSITNAEMDKQQIKLGFIL